MPGRFVVELPYLEFLVYTNSQPSEQFEIRKKTIRTYMCRPNVGRGSRGKPGQWGSPATLFQTRLCVQLVFMVVVSARQYTG